MLQVGKINNLQIVKSLDFGIYLDGEDKGEILMPSRYVPEDAKIGDFIDVFIYLDSEDRLIATTETPYTKVGEFSCLQVIAVNASGAFLDWGLPKDLFLPFAEQKDHVVKGKSYVVFTYVDGETGRIACSTKLGQFLKKGKPELEEGEEVNIMIVDKTNIGYRAIINDQYMGMLYENQVFTALKQGDKKTAYIKGIRPDNKIDLVLHKPGFEKVAGISGDILHEIKESGGFLPVTDKTPSQEIYVMFGISKKTFKKAIGTLYKERKIKIEEKGIRLIE